eukprot:1222260-Prymnesium_polylepis.1
MASVVLRAVRLRCEALPPCEPLALCEAFVAVTSGVVLWIGFWDLLEEIVPDVWYAKLLMIVFGGSGLFCTRQLYAHQRPTSATDTRAPKHADPRSTETGAELSSPPPERIGTVLPALSPPERSKCNYFNAPVLHAGKCARSLCTIAMGLVLWVGIWDLLDYHIIPAVTRLLIVHNGSALGVCEHASDDPLTPGIGELMSHPGCSVVKALLVVVGVLGLYVTRTLYGAETNRESAFKRLP